MAARIVEQYYSCDVCAVSFPFQSKLERHLQSARHKQFSFSLEMDAPPEVEQAEVPSIADDEQAELHNPDTYMDTEEGCELDCVRVRKDYDCNNRAGETDSEGCSDVGSDWGDGDSSYEGLQEIILEMKNTMATSGNDYHPFPSKLFFLLFLTVNSPRPLGESNLSFVWFILKQLGMTVPSLTKVKNFPLPGFKPPSRHLTSGGTPFYVNSLVTTLSQCLGNVDIAKQLTRYPVETEGSFREMFHGKRWREDPRFHSPMVTLADDSHVFIRDCIGFTHPRFGWTNGLVSQFYAKDENDQLHAVVDVLLTFEQFRGTVQDGDLYYLPFGTFVLYETMNILITLIESHAAPPLDVVKWNQSSHVLEAMSRNEYSRYLAPHRLKQKAAGKPVVMVPLILYSDDTSGNKSKKWHQFNSWDVLLAGMPREANHQIPNIHFLCCSDKVSVLEMAEPITKELIDLEMEGLEVYDAHLRCMVLMVAPVLCAICDNPRASELVNHLTGNPLRFCRMCDAHRNNSPMELGIPRCSAVALRTIVRIRDEVTETAKAALRTQHGLSEQQNPLITLPVDLYRSTPVETLHTLLLGPYKYLLRSTMSKLSNNQKQEILARMRAFNYSGFTVRVYGNITKYYGSFVGRDFKAWAQMALFILGPYLKEDEVTVWLCLSKVFRIAYCEDYNPRKKAECQRVCQEFVSTVCRVYPEYTRKPKIHLLLHLTDSMEQFGPTSAFNTERCETFNSFIRGQNIHGNKAAPSKDIAYRFARIEYLRYICSSQSSGRDLRELFQTPGVQRFFNIATSRALHHDKAIYQPGTLRKVINTTTFGNVKVRIKEMNEAVEIKHLKPPLTLQRSVAQDKPVKVYGAVVDHKGNLVRVGDFAQIDQDEYGELLACCDIEDMGAVCVLRDVEEVRVLGEPVTNEYDCPLVMITNTLRIVHARNVVRATSIVHQCSATCTFTHTNTAVTREREEVTSQVLTYVHDYSNQMYCANMYCMY